MKLLFLHGSPATGKLTVAKALLRLVAGRLMDNHAAIDLALTIFDFDAPGFWELVHDVRYSAIDAAASGESLNKYLDSYDFTAVPRPDCLKLDTGRAPAEVTAQSIVDHFGLTPAST